jgi:hypothetical protein
MLISAICSKHKVFFSTLSKQNKGGWRFTTPLPSGGNMEKPVLEKFSVAIPLSRKEKTAFEQYCFEKGMKRGGFLRNAILAVIAPEKKEVENAEK